MNPEKAQGKNELSFEIEENSDGDRLQLRYKGKDGKFSFDYIFGSNTEQERLYNRIAKATVANLFKVGLS